MHIYLDFREYPNRCLRSCLCFVSQFLKCFNPWSSSTIKSKNFECNSRDFPCRGSFFPSLLRLFASMLLSFALGADVLPHKSIIMFANWEYWYSCCCCWFYVVVRVVVVIFFFFAYSNRFTAKSTHSNYFTIKESKREMEKNRERKKYSGCAVCTLVRMVYVLIVRNNLF